MIKVYWMDCTPLMDASTLARILPTLNEERRKKTLRYKTAERRAQSAAAGLLLRRLFGDAKYTHGPNGKPYLINGNGVCFSLSHSGRVVVCAVADFEVGIDIEPISVIRPAVLRRCFTPGEQRWIANDPHRFTQLWTMKEAYMKLTGTGLSVAAKDLSLPLPPTDGYDEEHHCYWATIHHDTYMISVAAAQPINLDWIPITIT